MAIGAGAVMALAFPPFNLAFMPWLCLPLLIFMLRGKRVTSLRAFVIGWCFAFGTMVAGLHWMAGSLFVDIEKFWWVLPLAVAGLPALFAIYYGLAAMVAVSLWRKTTPISGALLFAILWFMADFARGHLFTGFPWNLVGHAWSGWLPVLQVTSVVGIYGLTLLTIVAAVLPALAFGRCGSRSGKAALVAAIIAFAAIAMWGEHRLTFAPAQTDTADVRLRLVQPNVVQAEKWKPEEREAIFMRLLRLSQSGDATAPITHVIWPETATAFPLGEYREIRRRIADVLPDAGSLVTGSLRREFLSDEDVHYYNSIVSIDHHANLVGGYDKFHLVPFGEYIPLRQFLPSGILSIVGKDFSGGSGASTMRVAGLPPFSPLVCYEAIFSGEVVEETDPPQFLLNLTNDGWFDGTIGPAQHFAVVRLRAIEEGLPLVRVANQGITAVVDAWGRVVAQTDGKDATIVDSALPRPAPTPTIFAQYRHIPMWIMLALLVVIIGIGQVWRRKR